MTINLTPEQEKIVKEELESGHFRTAEELISQALHTLLATAPSSSASTDNGGRHKAVRELRSRAFRLRNSFTRVIVCE